MILAYDNIDFEAKRPLLPMSYWSNNRFRQGGYLWLKNIHNRQDGLRHKKTPKNSQSFHYLSLPAPTKTAQTSIASQTKRECKYYAYSCTVSRNNTGLVKGLIIDIPTLTSNKLFPRKPLIRTKHPP